MILFFFRKIHCRLWLISEWWNYSVSAREALILHGIHLYSVCPATPKHLLRNTYIWIWSLTTSWAVCGSTISRPLFPACSQFFASSCITLKSCSGVLDDLLKARLFLSFHSSQVVNIIIERTPFLVAFGPLSPISAYHWLMSSVWVQLAGLRCAALIQTPTLSQIIIE